MPIYAAPARSVVELGVFTGGRASADTFGLTEIKRQIRDAGPDQPPWGEVEDEQFHTLDGTTPIEPGTVFERQAIEQQDGSLILGAWRIVGHISTMREGDYEAVNLNRTRSSAPGANLKNPLGLVHRTTDGDPITRPAVGEQDLDPWTGEPLVDEAGDPILVED